MWCHSIDLHKSERPRDFSQILPAPYPVAVLQSYSAIFYSNWRGTLFKMAYTALAPVFVLLHTRIGKGAMKKFGICSKRCIGLFSMLIGPMNDLRIWNLRRGI